ncbi:MAG: hypothetical protein ABJP34_12280 [Erythrobacter sp.]
MLIFLGAAFLLLRSMSAANPDEIAEIPEAEKQSLGLMTSLPIYWNEGDVFADFGSGEQAELPWVRQTIAQRYQIRPLDLLAGDDLGNDPLEGLQRLAIIQPRGISPAGNVALDDWVRGGGRLLYVIDPMLSGEYEAALGDPRHPTVTALVPPVIARWGLSLSFDEDQSEEPRLVQWGGLGDELILPVVMAGELSTTDTADPPCTIAAEALVARCEIGKGSVTLVADAALFEPREGNAEAEHAVLAMLSKALD